MKKIAEFENPSQRESYLPTFLDAYRRTNRFGNTILDFNGIILQRDVSAIANTLDENQSTVPGFNPNLGRILLSFRVRVSYSKAWF